MKDSCQAKLEEALKDIPAGTFAFRHHSLPEEGGSPEAPQLEARTAGKGRIETFSVFPGLEVAFHQYLADRVEFRHQAQAEVVEIDHCRRGRIGWDMGGSATVYLGGGDLCVHSRAACANSRLDLPLGYYQGVSVSANLEALRRHPPEILRNAPFLPEEVWNRYGRKAAPTGIPASRETDALFFSFYQPHSRFALPLFLLKAQEVLLYLLERDSAPQPEVPQVGPQQTELIKEIRQFLVDHLDQRYTIEELAKRYLINTSTLKASFKAVYGMPLAAYVKSCRMNRAMALLRETDLSIAAIAVQVGYGTQGKFTKAFKETVRLLPTEYRKQFLS